MYWVSFFSKICEWLHKHALSCFGKPVHENEQDWILRWNIYTLVTLARHVKIPSLLQHNKIFCDDFLYMKLIWASKATVRERQVSVHLGSAESESTENLQAYMRENRYIIIPGALSGWHITCSEAFLFSKTSETDKRNGFAGVLSWLIHEQTIQCKYISFFKNDSSPSRG